MVRLTVGWVSEGDSQRNSERGRIHGGALIHHSAIKPNGLNDCTVTGRTDGHTGLCLYTSASVYLWESVYVSVPACQLGLMIE